ncbi:hypothetical protein [Winogradskyella sp. J14-2]|uniref:hypothetical protein n=1 Tax=Winogradskyella sp. J14-2 TaxID=1936080 RepID=UPI0012F717A4|nr:hypothetical protein [Winogradskyella sp. J14-2]
MDYPSDIIPSPDKKELACDLSDCIIFRFYVSNPELDFLNKGDMYINQKYISDPSSNISDLSTNLYGVFTIEDGKIQIFGDKKSYYYEYCKVNDEIEIPVYNVDFQLVNNRSFWYMKISKINNEEAQYNNPNPQAKSFKAKCIIVHTPMRWNYWHFSLRWFIHQDDKEPFWLHELASNQQRKYVKKLSTESRSILAKNIETEIPMNFKILQEEDFKII